MDKEGPPMSTAEYLDKLTLEQLRFARDYAANRIKQAEESTRRTVWVVTDGIVNLAWFREEQPEAAADQLLAIFKERFVTEAKRFVAKPYSPTIFSNRVPHVHAHRCCQLEYDTEWFPSSEASHD